MKIYDISLPIKPGMLTYPGDPKVKLEKYKSYPSKVTYLHMGAHTGTHVDAPKHVLPKGKSVDAMKLDVFVGECRVLNLTSTKKAISVADLKKHRIKRGERILAKTKNSSKTYAKFWSDYIYLSSEAAQFLALKKIRLFGIDYLSVKQRGSNDNRPHSVLLKKNIAIIEGVNLSKVPTGSYYFVGAPLRIVGGDGSPIRAILMNPIPPRSAGRGIRAGSL